MGIQQGQSACCGDGIGTAEMGWVLQGWAVDCRNGDCRDEDCRDGYHRAGLAISGIEWVLHRRTGYCSDGCWSGCWDAAHPCICGVV